MRAQTEIIGVMVIVIILVLGGVFYLSFSLNKDDPASVSFVDPEQAQSFLTALLDTKTKKDMDVSEVITACYNDDHHYCGQTSTSDCCNYGELVITNALEATFGEWGKDYWLTIEQNGIFKIPDDRDAISNTLSCNENEQPGKRVLPNLGRPIIVTLKICK